MGGGGRDVAGLGGLASHSLQVHRLHYPAFVSIRSAAS